ncbi:MAG: glycosyltransferase family 2 protein [Ruminococcaceae bacterium]|nr:glycosyltransferase family 2 protein [Oscillospiraceae bacterium]
MKTLIIIPAYNESENIERVIADIKNNCPDYDYLIVNDCSTDHTAEICKKNNFNYIDLCCNLGIGGGVQSGYIYAYRNGYDYAVQIDGDGQHDPQYISGMIEVLEKESADMVVGSRFITKEGFQSSGMRRFGINFLSALIRMVCGAKVKDVTSGFRVANRKYIEFFSKEYADDYPEPEAIVAVTLSGGKVVEAPVIMREREGGVSSISPFKSIYYMIKVSLAILLYRITYKGGAKK